MFEHEVIELNEMESVTTEAGRFYKTPEGIDLPSITTVLGSDPDKKKGLIEWRKKVGEEEANKISHRAAQRGTAVHEIIEKYVNNDPNYKDGYMYNIVSDFLDVKDILDSRLSKVYAQEAPLYSKFLGVAGRVDCVGVWDGKIAIIDYKTSRKTKRKQWIHDYFMQACAYSIMWEERTGMPITQLVIVISVDNAKSQVFVEHRDNWVRPLRETIDKYNQRNNTATLM